MRAILKYIFALILLFAVNSGCDKQENIYPPDEDYIVFGHYYGMCFGEQCVEIFKIENQQLFEDTLDEYANFSQPYHCVFVKAILYFLHDHCRRGIRQNPSSYRTPGI